MRRLCCLLWLWVLMSDVSTASSQRQKAWSFKRCHRNAGIYKGDAIATFTSSKLRCFEKCAEDDDCRSVNVCPSGQPGERQWKCELLDSYSRWSCKQLTTVSDPRCFHAEKVSHCQHGGRPRDDGTCVCDLCYKGTTCSQHVRDCQEAAELAAADGGYSSAAVCDIQPSTSPLSFSVRCPFGGSDVTPVLLRVQTSKGWSQLAWGSYGWLDFRAGLGSYDVLNFFLGLENLRHLLRQAEYRLNVYNVYHCPPSSDTIHPSFRNVTVQGEEDGYALTYSLYTNNVLSSPLQLEGFHGPNLPHRFCTADRDCGTCAARGGPGWYYVEEGECWGHSPFAPLAQWPYGEHGLLTIRSSEYFMERVGDFY